MSKQNEMAGAQTRNRNIEPILSLVQKRNTKSKRTKVLVKKSRELSILCNLDINITIYDRSINKIQQFSTKEGFTIDSIYQMIQNETRNKSSHGKKFKMKIINCTNQLDLGNDSEDSDNETDIRSKVMGRQSEDGKKSDIN